MQHSAEFVGTAQTVAGNFKVKAGEFGAVGFVPNLMGKQLVFLFFAVVKFFRPKNFHTVAVVGVNSVFGSACGVCQFDNVGALCVDDLLFCCGVIGVSYVLVPPKMFFKLKEKGCVCYNRSWERCSAPVPS